VRPAPADRADLAIRRVEGAEAGVGTVAPHFGVDAATVLVLAFARGPVVAASEGGVQSEIRGHGPHRGTAPLRAEQSPDGEGLIAQQLAAGAEARTAGEEAVVGIALLRFGRDVRDLAVGAAGDELDEEALHVPAVLHE